VSQWPGPSRRRALILSAALPVLLCACQPQPAERSGPAGVAVAAAAWPGFDYPSAATADRHVFLLDPARTLIEVVVRRDGPLARFGHDHVVTVQEPEGFLLLDETGPGSRADLRFRPDHLDVDSAEARGRHDLDTDPDATDIAGTRENLMEHVLDSTAWPWATLQLTAFERQDDHYSALVTIGINGGEYSSRQPFRLGTADGSAVVEGFLVVRQTELGLQPFSALGGGLRVADPLEVHFHIEATAR
jgi:hypothetical protein